VTGDKIVDAIAVNYDSGVIVHRGQFYQALDGVRTFSSAAENWTPGPLYGYDWEFFVDVTGDGRADMVMDDLAGIKVRHSLGNRLADLDANNRLIINSDFPRRRSGLWTEERFGGDTGGVAFAKVDGGGSDAIAINSDGLWVRTNRFRPSSCSQF
jgi:hypothetical protein